MTINNFVEFINLIFSSSNSSLEEKTCFGLYPINFIDESKINPSPAFTFLFKNLGILYGVITEKFLTDKFFKNINYKTFNKGSSCMAPKTHPTKPNKILVVGFTK